MNNATREPWHHRLFAAIPTIILAGLSFGFIALCGVAGLKYYLIANGYIPRPKAEPTKAVEKRKHFWEHR